MKSIISKAVLTIVGVVAFTGAAQCQGTFNFLTFNSTPTLGRVFAPGGALAGNTYVGQIWGSASSADPSTFTAVGTPQAFVLSNGNPQGVINAGITTVSGVAAGTAFNYVLRAWDVASGSFANALASGTSGQSNVQTITLGGGGPPPLASPNVNTFANVNMTVVPEPSVVALALLGAGALLFRRRKA